MSDDEARSTARIAGHEEETDEVEAHHRPTANQEPGDETDNDVEGHMRRAAPDAESNRQV